MSEPFVAGVPNVLFPTAKSGHVADPTFFLNQAEDEGALADSGKAANCLKKKHGGTDAS